MQNVLVVDDEQTLLMIMTGRFEDYKDRFQVFTAGNGKEAIKVLDSEQIDLVVTDLKMPEMDGIELIAYISNKFPAVPTIAVSAYCTPEIQKKLKGLGTLRVMDKPVNLDLLAETVLTGLEQAHDGGSLNCVSLSSFLQLVEMEEKSCRIDVHTNSQQRGSFFLVDGEMHDASCGELRGETAAHEMIGWDNTHLYIKDLPKKPITRRIKRGLMSVVMEGLRKKDESPMEQKQNGPDREEKHAANTKSSTDPGSGKDAPARASSVKVIKSDPEDSGPIFGPDDDTFTSELDNVLDILSEDPAVADLVKDTAAPEPKADKDSPAPKPKPSADATRHLLSAPILEAAHTDQTLAEVVAALVQKVAEVVPIDVAILFSAVEGRGDGLRISNLIYSDQRIVDTSTVMPLSGSLVEQVLKNNTPAALNLTDIASGSVEQKLLDRLKMKSCCLIPLVGPVGQPVLLVLAAQKEKQFDDCGPQLEWVIGSLTLALERVMLQKGITGQLKALETVRHIQQTLLSGAMETERLLTYVMDQIREVFQVEAGSLFIKEKDYLKMVIAFNTVIGTVKKYQLKIGQGFAGTAAAKAKPMIVNDAQKSPLLLRDLDKQTGFSTRSVLCVPLIAYKNVIGVFELLNRPGQEFTSDDENQLLSIASALSIALVFKRSQAGR